jgi:hypothetical protein
MPEVVSDLLAPHTSGPRDVPRCGSLQKTPHYRGVGKIAARLNVKLWDLPGDWWHLSAISPSHPLPGRLGSSEMVLFLREAMRAIASLGCEGAMRAIASSMSPHASPQQSPTPIFSAATAGGRTTT